MEFGLYDVMYYDAPTSHEALYAMFPNFQHVNEDIRPTIMVSYSQKQYTACPGRHYDRFSEGQSVITLDQRVVQKCNKNTTLYTHGNFLLKDPATLNMFDSTFTKRLYGAMLLEQCVFTSPPKIDLESFRHSLSMMTKD